MPTCKKCSCKFPNWLVIDDKRRCLSKRKYCLDCSPFGQHNTRDPDRVRKGEEVVCNRCGRIYIYDKSKGHGKSLCNSCVVNTRRFEKKKRAVKYKGGKCEICGYDRFVEAMDFHHVGQKSFDISGAHCFRWERIQAELDKCILLCATCHREIHVKERDRSSESRAVAS